MTGGRFFSAHARRQLEEIYAELDRLEPSERDERSFRPQRSLFMWPAGVALLLSFGMAGHALLLSAGGRRRVV
jgi:Ca-activated chloride channel family protein